MTPNLRKACARSLHTMGPEGTIRSAGRAVLAILTSLGWRRTASLLEFRPLFWAVEFAYHLVARNRNFATRVTRWIGYE